VTDAAAPINRLRAIARRLVDRRDVDGAWFMTALLSYQAGARHGLSLDAAFGLTPESGARGWWTEELQLQRDVLLRAIACEYFGTLSHRAAAAEIMRQLGRYQAGRWRKHRDGLRPPAGATDLQLELFKLLKIDAAVSARTIERALRHEPPDFVAHEPASNAARNGEGSHEDSDLDETATAATNA